MGKTNDTATVYDLGNNESAVAGIFADEQGVIAMTPIDSKSFKTRAGAAKWLARRGYNSNGSRIARAAVSL